MPAVIAAQCFAANVINGSSVTRSVDFGSTADRAAIVIMGRASSSTVSPTGCTVDGVAATQVDSWTGGSGTQWKVFTATGVGTGARDVVMTWSGVSGDAIYLIVPLNDTTSLSHKTRHTAATPPGPTSTFASASGRLAVQSVVFEGSSAAATAGSGATLVWSDGGNLAHVVTEPCSASTTIDTTISGSAIMRGATVEATGSGDTTPPTLTSPSGTGGTLTCSGSVSTNEANGNLYAVVTGSATAPTAAQVKLGQDHTGASALRAVGPQSVSTTGVQTIGSGACSAGTRYFHFMHEDAAANQSAVVSSASFTVSAATPTTATLSGPSSGTTGSPSTNFTVTLNAAADTTYTVTPAGTNGTVTFTPSSPSIGVGQTTVTFTATAALDGLHDISITTSPSLTIAGSPVAYTTSSVSGFDLHTDPYIFGDLAGGLTGLTRETSVGITLAVYAIDTTTVPGAKIPGSKLWQSGILTTDSNGKLTRQTNAAFTAGTEYMLLFVRQSDGQTCAVTAAAT